MRSLSIFHFALHDLDTFRLFLNTVSINAKSPLPSGLLPEGKDSMHETR